MTWQPMLPHPFHFLGIVETPGIFLYSSYHTYTDMVALLLHVRSDTLDFRSVGVQRTRSVPLVGAGLREEGEGGVDATL